MSVSLGLYRAATAMLEPAAPFILRRRLARGKELPHRWREKLGHTDVPRQVGRLIWMHGVGVGEVLALRGLIALMRAKQADLSFLVTSTARSSAFAWAHNPEEGALHQFLPLDLPRARRRFLNHWRPDLVIWAEQDIWPGFCDAVARRSIPQALVNARMDEASFSKRMRAKGLYQSALKRMAVIDGQDDQTATNLTSLGAKGVTCLGSLKPIAPPLTDWPAERALLTEQIGARAVWLLASSHSEDEAIAIDAQRRLKDRLLIIAPRSTERAPEIAQACAAKGLSAAVWSQKPTLTSDTDVLIADSFGQMGLWYRLADMALIGGSFGAVEGHNPWEAVALCTPVLHGPRTKNFANDYQQLEKVGGARLVLDADAVAHAIKDANLVDTPKRASGLLDDERKRKDALADRLLRLLEHPS